MKGTTNDDFLRQIRTVVREEIRSEITAVNHKLELIERKIGEASEINVRHHLATKAEAGSLNQQFMIFREGFAAATQMPH